jgi:carbonic anhydrase
MKRIDFIYRFDPSQSPGRPLPADGAEARRLLEDGNRLFARWIESCQQDRDTADEQTFVVPYSAEELGLPQAAGAVVKQAPFAALLGCSDARVPAEIIFGQSRNSLFVVRLAGNVLSDECLGSIDFAVNHLSDSIRIVVALGHTRCGAVAAAVDTYLQPWSYLEKTTTHALRTIVDRIFIPVRKAARALEKVWGPGVGSNPAYRDALIETAVFVNTAQTAYDLRRAMDEIGRHDLEVVYGVFDLLTHRVRVLPVHQSQPLGVDIYLADAPANLADFETLTDRIAQYVFEHQAGS